MEAEPSGPPDMGGKTFAQLQAEEERAARKASKAVAKQTAGSAAAAARPPSAGAAAASVPRPTPIAAQPAAQAATQPLQQQQVQQQPAAAAAPRLAAPAAAAGPAAAGGAAAGAAAAAAVVASSAQARNKPALERLGDELTALKGTLRPMIATLQAAKVRTVWSVVHCSSLVSWCSLVADACTRHVHCSSEAECESKTLPSSTCSCLAAISCY